MVSGRLGGAALASQPPVFTKFRIPRGVARKTLEMLADPRGCKGAHAWKQRCRSACVLRAVAAELVRTSK